MGERYMRTRFRRVSTWCCLAGGCLFQGCAIAGGIDPDLFLRATLSVASDATIFLLENLAAAM